MHETHDNTQATLAFLLLAVQRQYLSPRAGRLLLKTWFQASERPIDRLAVELALLDESVASGLASEVDATAGGQGDPELSDEEAVEAEVLRLLSWTGFEPEEGGPPEHTRGEASQGTLAWPDRVPEVPVSGQPSGVQLTAGAMIGFDPPSLADPLDSSLVAAPLDSDATRPIGSTTEVDLGPTGTRPGEDQASAVLPYVVQEPLAEGGLGEVLIAKDIRLNRKIALKRILPRFLHDQRSRARFQVEAEITGGLEHPGVVPIYAIGAYDDGRPFYAMRLVDGETLRAAIDRLHQPHGKPRTLEFRKILGRFVAVCNVVAYAHSRRVLHRDIKPSNILLGKYGETLLIDWGLAKVIGGPDLAGHDAGPTDATVATLPETSSISGEPAPLPPSGSVLNLTLIGSAVGTPAYMSPEQARSDLEAVGPPSDVYGLGATLYAILTGRSPGGTRGGEREILKRMASGQFPRPREIRRDIPEALEAICLRAMAAEPRDRYDSPKALAEDVERWLADEPLPWRKESWDRRISRLERRHRGIIRVAGMALVLLSAGALVAATMINLAREKEQIALREARAGKSEAERATVEVSRTNSRLLIDEAIRDSGQEPGESLLKFIHACRDLPEDAADLDRVARLAMPGVLERMHTVRGIIDPEGQANAMAIDRSSRLIATGTERGDVALWAARDVSPVGEAVRIPGTILGLEFSGDGSSLLVRTGLPRGSGSVVVLEVAGLRPRFAPIQRPSESRAATFAPDGKTFATGDASGEIAVREVQTGRLVWKGIRQEGPVADLVYHPDGRLIAGGERRTILVLDPRTGQPIGKPAVAQEEGRAAGPEEKLKSLTLAPDGKHLASTGEQACFLFKVGDPGIDPAGQKIDLNRPFWVRFGDDNRHLMGCGYNNSVRFWKLDADGRWGSQERYLPHRNYVKAFDLSRGGHLAISGSRDRVAQIWRIDGDDAHRVGQSLLHPKPVEAALMSPDGTFAVTRDEDRVVRVWGIASPRVSRRIAKFDSSILNLAMTPDGSELLVGTGPAGKLQRIDPRDGKPTAPPIDHGDVVWTFAADRSGSRVVIGGGNRVRIYDLASGNPLGPPIAYDQQVLSVAWHPDGRRILVGSREGIVRVLIPETGARAGEIKEEGQSIGNSIRFTPDGTTLVVGGSRGNIYLYDAGTFLTAAAPLVGHLDPVRSLDFSDDGGLLFSASQDSTARIFDLRRRQSPGVTLAHGNWVTRIRNSSDGRLLATTSLDHFVRIWDLATGRLVWASPDQAIGLWSLTFHPDGRSLIVGSERGEVSVWEIPVPLTEDLATIELRAEMLTNLQLTEQGEVVPMSAAEWQTRRASVLAKSPSRRGPADVRD